MVSTLAFSRIGTATLSHATKMQSRLLSTQGEAAIQKLQNALEEYRSINYTQEIPSRFKKDIVRAAQRTEADNGIVVLEGMQRVIANINMEHRVSHSDMEIIFQEMGGGDAKAISRDSLMTIL